MACRYNLRQLYSIVSIGGMLRDGLSSKACQVYLHLLFVAGWLQTGIAQGVYGELH